MTSKGRVGRRGIRALPGHLFVCILLALGFPRSTPVFFVSHAIPIRIRWPEETGVGSAGMALLHPWFRGQRRKPYKR
jgi:hypothetical protein